MSTVRPEGIGGKERPPRENRRDGLRPELRWVAQLASLASFVIGLIVVGVFVFLLIAGISLLTAGLPATPQVA
jgi:hypothetical protein